MIWTAGQQLKNRQYIIQEVIGVGRFGITYRAIKRDAELIVIKTPNDESLQRADFDRLQQVFVQEAFKLAKCKHPHIVKAEEPFQEDGIWCIPMEYIGGITLAKRDRKILPEDEAINYIRQIGEALVVVHQNDLLHRDVTPDNIMLRIRNGESEAVLIDFGLARDFDNDLTQTRTEEITTGFTPLELYSRHAELGAWTDIYSLGATLYNLLTGKVPVDAKERKLSNTRLDFPEHVTNRFRQAINWAMELEVKNRPQSIQEWLDSLENRIESATINTSIQETRIPIEQKKADKIELNKNKIEIWQLLIGAVAALGALLSGLSIIPSLMNVKNPSPPMSPTSTPTHTP